MAITLDGVAGISASGNITAAGTISASTLVLGNITTAGQISAAGNITAGGTLTVGTFAPTSFSASGNVTGGNILTAGIVSATGNITGGNLSGTSIVGTLTTAAQTNITSVGTLGSLAVTGNTTAGNFVGTLNGSGANVTAISATNVSTGTLAQARLANAAVTLGSTALTLGSTVTTVAGLTSVTSTTFVGALTGAATTAATVTTAAQPNITSVGTLTSVSVSGNVTAGNLSGTSIVGTLTTAAQTNITSVGTLSSLSVTGNVTAGNVNAGNITIAADLISSLGTTLTIDPATSGNAGLVVINGNLQVNGTTTTINSNVVSTNDLTVNYANNAINAAAANGGGIEIGPIGSPFITWLYNNSSNVFTSSGGISAVGNITGGNLSGTSIVGTLTTAAQTNITSVGTLGSLSVTGNITGGNLLGTIRTAAQTNITSVGTLGSLSVTGNITGGNLITAGLVSLSSITKTGSNGVGNIGAAASAFNTVFAKATSAQYADVAERYQADRDYAPGTVLIIGGGQEVTASTVSHDHRAAGVVSEKPSYLMNSGLDTVNSVAVALLGRVPCQVIGQITRGQLLVSSDTPGTAIALDHTRYVPGCVIGKALEDYNNNVPGTIEIAVGIK